MPDSTCSVVGCDKPSRTRKMCYAHYARWRRNGDPGPAEMQANPYRPGMTEKACTGCKQVKPLDDFHRVNRGSRYVARCKVCRNAEIVVIARKRRYGVEHDEYLAMIEAQGGKCAICDGTHRLCIDHDHATGAVRKLLCDMCNKALGMAEDNPQRLRDMAAYLEAH